MGAYKYYNPSTSKWEIIKSKSIIKPDGSLEYTPDDIKSIDDKVSGLESSFNVHQADLASQEVGKGADIIALPDPDSLFTATNVRGAMQELFTNVSSGKSLVGGAITGVDDSVVIPTDPTFNDLANAVSQISTGKKYAEGIGALLSGSFSCAGLDFHPSKVIFVFRGRFGGSTNYAGLGVISNEADLLWGVNGFSTNITAVNLTTKEYLYNLNIQTTMDGFNINMPNQNYISYMDGLQWWAFE